MGFVFASPLHSVSTPFRFDGPPFRHFLACFLALPPITTIAAPTVVEGFDYAVQACSSGHGASGLLSFLDAHGNHAAAGCPTTKVARQRKHHYLRRVVSQFAREAG